MVFKETNEVGFDGDGFAVHKKCGTRLSEWWSIARDEEYSIKRDGTAVLVSDGGDDKECDGVFCDECEVHVTLEKEEPEAIPRRAEDELRDAE